MKKNIALPNVLQWCTIWDGTPLDTFCQAVQELHECLALVVEEGDLFNMEKEIQEGIMKEPMVATTSRAHTLKRAPLPKRVPSQIP